MKNQTPPVRGKQLTRGQPPGPARALLTLIYLHHARLGRPHTEWTDGPPTSLLFPPTAKAATITCRNRRRPGLTHHFLAITEKEGWEQELVQTLRSPCSGEALEPFLPKAKLCAENKEEFGGLGLHKS